MVGKLTPMTELSCSRLPAILGLSPYSTPNDELAKTVDALAGKPDADYSPSEAAAWGNLMEPVILAQMVERLRLDMWYSPSTPYAAPKGIALNASLDGVGGMLHNTKVQVVTDPSRGIYVIGAEEIILDGPGVLESKCADTSPEAEPALHRGPIQLQGCMLCSGYKWGAIGVLYRGRELRIFVYRRDEERIAEIIRAVEDFEKRKLGPDWYPPVNRADAANVWARAEEDAPAINLSNVAIDLMDRIQVAKQIIATAEQEVEECSAAVMEMLGNHTEGTAVDSDGTIWRVRWPMRQYKAQPAKTVPAKDAYTIRLKTLDIKIIEPRAN